MNEDNFFILRITGEWGLTAQYMMIAKNKYECLPYAWKLLKYL